MFRSRRRQRPTDRLHVYRGPRAKDPVTGKFVRVRLGSLTGTPSAKIWEPEERVLRGLFQPIMPFIREEVTLNGETRLYVVNPGRYEADRLRRLYYVDLGASELAGPFSRQQLEVFVTLRSGAGTTPVEAPVYVVDTTSAALMKMRDSPYAKKEHRESVTGITADPF